MLARDHPVVTSPYRLSVLIASDSMSSPPTQARRSTSTNGMRNTAIARPVERIRLSRIASTCSTRTQIPATVPTNPRIRPIAIAEPPRFSTAVNGAMIRRGTDAKAKVEKESVEGAVAAEQASNEMEDARLDEQDQRGDYQR